MPFQWIEFLEVARFLQHRSQGSVQYTFSQEAAIRCSVSRAYYSAFCHARNYARHKGWFIPTGHGSDHQNLITKLKINKKQLSAQKLHSLKKWRRFCDYDDHIQHRDYGNMSKFALKNADYVHNDLK